MAERNFVNSPTDRKQKTSLFSEVFFINNIFIYSGSFILKVSIKAVV
jgi:hypothetical protein